MDLTSESTAGVKVRWVLQRDHGVQQVFRLMRAHVVLSGMMHEEHGDARFRNLSIHLIVCQS
jgi:hypothetical protein